MKLESALARQQHKLYSIPVRDMWNEPPLTDQEIAARRRTIRISTDAFIDRGLMNGDPVALANCLGDTMLVMGGTCAQLGLSPEIDNLLLAAKAAVEVAQKALDKAIVLRDKDEIATQCAAIQLTCGGLCYVLSLPYREILTMLHLRYIEGVPPERRDIAAVLRANGFEVTDEAPPEAPAAPPPPAVKPGLIVVPR